MNSKIITTMFEEMRVLLLFCRYVLSRFFKDNCANTAAALTYTSLFAIVPALTIIFSVVTVMPAFEGMITQLQSFIFEHLVPASSSSVTDSIVEFATAAKQLSGVSLIVLVVTVILLLNTIEGAFNDIWGVITQRSLSSKLLLYWALITLGPFLLVGALTASITILSSQYLSFLQESTVIIELLSYLPLLLNLALFTLLFGFVPNCPVSLKHALIGALVCSVLFSVSKLILAAGLLSSNYNAVYGSFAAVPLFLLWIYICWIIVLFGANLTRCLPRYRSFQQQEHSELALATSVLDYLWRHRARGVSFSEAQWFKDKVAGLHKVDTETWLRLKPKLLHEQFILMTQSGEVALGRDLNKVTIRELLTTLEPNFLHGLSASFDGENVPSTVNRTLKVLSSEAGSVLDKPISSWCDENNES